MAVLMFSVVGGLTFRRMRQVRSSVCVRRLLMSRGVMKCRESIDMWCQRGLPAQGLTKPTLGPSVGMTLPDMKGPWGFKCPSGLS